MTVADLIVQRLQDAGVHSLFGVPGGGSNLDVIDAAGRAGLPFVLTATETGAALAAMAQSEITGAPGACLTTLGPGVASVVNGVACAFLDRVPLIVITDRHPSAIATFYHQTLDHQALLAPVTKWSVRLDRETADDTIARAIETAIAPRPGPVHLDFPVATAVVPRPWDGPAPPPRPSPDDQDFGAALASLLAHARAPMLVIGLGARRPADVAAIRSLCATHHLPAMVTYKAKGVVADDDPHFAGVFTNAKIDEKRRLVVTDLIIGIGLDPVELLPRPWTSMPPVVTCGPSRVDEEHILFAGQIVGDVPAAVRRVADLLPRDNSWSLDGLRRALLSDQREAFPDTDRLAPHRVVQVTAAALPDARVTVDAGAHMLPATMLWPVNAPNDMLISNGLSTMGFALPAAIGAALLDRARPVVALTGDGGLLMCAGELLTAARERLRIITVVFNDGSLSLIELKQRQRRLPPAGMRLGEVDWSSLASSVGVRGHCATTVSEFEQALRTAIADDGPSLIDARIDASSYAATLGAIRG